MLRDVSSPGGTVEDTQTLRDTPDKQHKAWLYDEGATTGAAADDTGATTGGAAERRKLELELELILSRWLWERGEKGGASLQKQARVRALCGVMQ